MSTENYNDQFAQLIEPVSKPQSFHMPFQISRGSKSFEKKKIKRNGKIVKVNAYNTFAQRVSDVTISFLQIEAKRRGFDYYKIKSLVVKELEPKLAEYGLNDFDKMSNEQRNMAKYAVEHALHKKLMEFGNFVISIGFREFIEALDEKSLFQASKKSEGAIRFDRSIEMINKAHSSSQVSYQRREVNEDFSKVNYVVGSVYLIPKIEFVIDEQLKDIKSVEQLMATRKMNKEKYIKEVRIHFDPSAFSTFAIPRSHKNPHELRKRHFRTVYASFLDLYMKTIEEVEYESHLNKLSFAQIQEIFGVKYARYPHFKTRVLAPAIEELNEKYKEYGTYQIELVENRVSRNPRSQLETISFKIIPLEDLEEHKQTFFFDLPTYIASRHYYFDDYVKRNFTESFSSYRHFIAGFIEENKETPDLIIGGAESNDLPIREWIREHKAASENYSELEKYLERDREWLNENNIYFSEDKLCLVKKVDGEDTIITILGGMISIINPITSLGYYKELRKIGTAE